MTHLLPLHPYKLKDREDIIRNLVNREDPADPVYPPIPKFQVKKLTLSEAVKTAMAWDARKFICSFLP